MAKPRRAFAICVMLLVLVACLLHNCAAAQSRPAGEAALLLQMKSSWGNPPMLAAWNTTSAMAAAGAHCRWSYVGCDSAGRVTNLTLGGINLTGPIPKAVGGLSSLTHLDVHNNYITGPFPTVLYRCRLLRYLDLSWNQIGGELPDDIGHGFGVNLRRLDLSINGFNGTIPVSLSRLQNLRYLVLAFNNLTGAIPAQLGELTSLEVLRLEENRFNAGEVLASFKNLTNLVALVADKCNIIGDFLSYVVNMPELKILYLQRNLLTGTIPPGIWGLRKLEQLDVTLNNLTGDVMVDDGFAAMSLTSIGFSYNRLIGTIPEAFGRLENLTQLDLSGNNFSGEIPLSIGWLPSLTTLYLENNRLTGMLPLELGKHSPGLQDVQIYNNNLTGRIPEGLCAGGQLLFLNAASNRFNGSIPVELAQCNTLEYLILDDNHLSGKVPEAMWTAGPQQVRLRNNRLTGSFPATISSNLTGIDIDNNQFVGRIPTVAVALEEFSAENNQFSGEIPADLGYGMPLLYRLNLANNKLSGWIC